MTHQCSPNHRFYKPTAGSYSKTTSCTMLWRTNVLQTIVFISPLRGLIHLYTYIHILYTFNLTFSKTRIIKFYIVIMYIEHSEIYIINMYWLHTRRRLSWSRERLRKYRSLKRFPWWRHCRFTILRPKSMNTHQVRSRDQRQIIRVEIWNTSGGLWDASRLQV